MHASCLKALCMALYMQCSGLIGCTSCHAGSIQVPGDPTTKGSAVVWAARHREDSARKGVCSADECHLPEACRTSASAGKSTSVPTQPPRNICAVLNMGSTCFYKSYEALVALAYCRWLTGSQQSTGNHKDSWQIQCQLCQHRALA